MRLVSSGSDVYYTVEWALKRSAEVELEGEELELKGGEMGSEAGGVQGERDVLYCIEDQA